MLSTDVDGQGAVNFEYDEMEATVMYSKIASSTLGAEIQGEDMMMTFDRINVIGEVALVDKEWNKNIISKPIDTIEHYYEVAEFISLVQSNKRESEINSHSNSLTTIEILDEIRRQIGLVYPADLK